MRNNVERLCVRVRKERLCVLAYVLANLCGVGWWRPMRVCVRVPIMCLFGCGFFYCFLILQKKGVLQGSFTRNASIGIVLQ